jgi:WD40 repeat protein
VLEFSPSGKLLAMGLGEGEVRLLDLAAGAQVASLKGHRGRVRTLRFTPDGKFIFSGSEDTSVAVWDLARAGVKAP